VFTRIAQRTISALQTATREGIAYHIDTRLRPSGNQGPLVCSLEAFADYHRAGAELWERQALVKARAVAGPPALRQRLESIIEGFVYGRGLTAAEVAEIARIRARMERERDVAEGGAVNIKTGRGGLVDVEFLVQMLQLRHGHEDRRLRTRVTRHALEELARAGRLAESEARALSEGYAFLRALENRLRIERNQPVEALEDDAEALLALARRLHYRGSDAQAVQALRDDHARHQRLIRDVYDRHFAGAT
jgi:glutamate-ammonia-ligase adenylyltransferase